MTWDDWRKTEYNTIGVLTDGNILTTNTRNIRYRETERQIDVSDLIDENKEYYTTGIPL